MDVSSFVCRLFLLRKKNRGWVLNVSKENSSSLRNQQSSQSYFSLHERRWWIGDGKFQSSLARWWLERSRVVASLTRCVSCANSAIPRDWSLFFHRHTISLPSIEFFHREPDSTHARHNTRKISLDERRVGARTKGTTQSMIRTADWRKKSRESKFSFFFVCSLDRVFFL